MNLKSKAIIPSAFTACFRGPKPFLTISPSPSTVSISTTTKSSALYSRPHGTCIHYCPFYHDYHDWHHFYAICTTGFNGLVGGCLLLCFLLSMLVVCVGQIAFSWHSHRFLCSLAFVIGMIVFSSCCW